MKDFLNGLLLAREQLLKGLQDINIRILFAQSGYRGEQEVPRIDLAPYKALKTL